MDGKEKFIVVRTDVKGSTTTEGTVEARSADELVSLTARLMKLRTGRPGYTFADKIAFQLDGKDIIPSTTLGALDGDHARRKPAGNSAEDERDDPSDA